MCGVCNRICTVCFIQWGGRTELCVKVKHEHESCFPFSRRSPCQIGLWLTFEARNIDFCVFSFFDEIETNLHSPFVSSIEICKQCFYILDWLFYWNIRKMLMCQMFWQITLETEIEKKLCQHLIIACTWVDFSDLFAQSTQYVCSFHVTSFNADQTPSSQ